jgi:AcrR family transcriptional regulator
MLPPNSVQPRHRGPKPLLGRQVIVEAALDCLSDGGPAALTMRGVATRLETGPSSLYAWVRNQRELHVLVLDAIAAEVATPDAADPPEQQLVDLLLDYGRRLFAYPGAARRALAAPPTGPAHLDLLERSLVLAERQGLDTATAASVLDTLFLLVTAGLAEQEARSADETPGSIPDLYADAISDDGPGARPHLATALRQLQATDGEQRLAWSISAFLRGAAG